MAVPIFLFTSGYLYTSSFNRAGIETLGSVYAPSSLIPKLVRFLIPLAIVCTAEILLARIIDPDTQFHFDLALISNGMGPGTYYIPLLFLFVFLIPVVYIATKVIGFYSVIVCFVLNGVYEILSRMFENPYYTILPLRFLFLISFGCWLFFHKSNGASPTCIMWVISILASLVGVVFIICTLYLDIDPVIVDIPWANVSYIACLYILPVMMFFIYYANLSSRLLAMMGKASFNIFLVQMLYYKFFADIVYSHFDSLLYGVIISILLCSVTGILFYRIEQPLSSTLLRKLKPRFE